MADPRVRVPDPEQEDRVALNTRVHPGIKRAVAAYAAQFGLSIQATVEHLLSVGLYATCTDVVFKRWAAAVGSAVTEQASETTQTGEGDEPLTGPEVPEDRSC
jgi:hypothetical protein